MIHQQSQKLITLRLLLAISLSMWPVLLTLCCFGILYRCVGTGVPLLDATKWPSVLITSCPASDLKCSAIQRLDLFIRIVTMCAALFPLVNLFNHFRAITRAVRQQEKASIAETVSNIALFIVYASFVFNAFWIVVTYFSKLGGDLNISEWMVILIFVLFTLADAALMCLYLGNDTQEGRLEYNYFFGNTFFIDLPTLIGIVIISRFSESVFAHNSASAVNETALALSGGAIVMHVVISQIAFAFLQLQVRLAKMF